LRQEDKELDGPELEQAEERRRESELVEEQGDEVYDLDGKRETRADERRTTDVVAAMRKILEGGLVNLDELQLPQRQLNALEAIKTAYEGKDKDLARFVFAEDRRALLEQALAVLQPELSSLQALGEPFKELIKNVGELREKLDNLESAEEELRDIKVGAEKQEAGDDAGDKDDEPDDEDDEADEADDGAEKPTTLGDEKEIAEAAAKNRAENLANAEPVKRVTEVVPRWRRPGG